MRNVQVADIVSQEDNHDNDHEQCVKNIQENLVRDEVTPVTLQVFDHSKDASDENESADSVQHYQVPPPRHRVLRRLGCWLGDNASVKPNSREDKEAEDGDLDEQSGDDGILAEVVRLQRLASLQTASGSLDSKRDDIASHEDFGHPLDGDKGQVFPVYSPNQAAEDHVY